MTLSPYQPTTPRLRGRTVPHQQPQASASDQAEQLASTLQGEAQHLIDAGLLPVPIWAGKHVPKGDTADRVYTAADFANATATQVRTGLQPRKMGLVPLYLVSLDLDQHKPWHNADARLEEFRRALGLTFAEIPRQRSTNGKGWHFQFYSPIPIATQTIYDPDGRHAGELICIGGSQRTSVPAFTPPLLGQEDRERILLRCHLRREPTAAICGTTDRKADIRAGLALVYGYERQHAPALRSFLEDGLNHRSEKLRTVAARMLGLLEGRIVSMNRSADYANLVQHLMLRAWELGTSPSERYRCVMKLAMQSDAFGKGSEKGYNQETDTAALIYRISIGAHRLDGGHFILPGWCKQSEAASAPPPAAVPAPDAPRRTPGRPSGDRAAQVAKLWRLLQHLAEDDIVSGYALDYFADQLGVKKRSVQNYLGDLESAKLIAHPYQEGKNGRLVIILKSPNGGANNSQQPANKPTETAEIRDARDTATDGVPTPQTGENASNGNKEEDHQNPCAPPPAPLLVASAPAALAAGNEPVAGRDDVALGSGSDAVGVQGFGDPLVPLRQPSTRRTPPAAVAVELPSSEPEAIAFVGGASFDPTASIPVRPAAARSLLGRPKAWLSFDEQHAALSRWEVLPDAPELDPGDEQTALDLQVHAAPEPATQALFAIVPLRAGQRRGRNRGRARSHQSLFDHPAASAAAPPDAAAPGQDGGGLSVTSAGLIRDSHPEPSPTGAIVVRCDHTGYITRIVEGVYFCALWPDGRTSEPTEYRDQAERAIREEQANAA